MPQPKTFYVTTPIYYVNSVPHVGSATTTLVADALARFHRQCGEPVFFLTGTDENAPKVANAAAKAGIPTAQFVDTVAQGFVDTWKFLDISNDDFIRTTQERHRDVVGEVFQRLQARGDIYTGTYEGWYSMSDETFFRDSDVVNGRAKETGAIVERVTDDVYYFRLSAYSDRLLAHIQANPDFLQPETRKNETLAFIKEGLRDVVVSRRNTGWGIPVPGNPSQVVYVWFDALINYLTATGWPDQPNWENVWPADIHLMAKEIYVRFHATLWPAMLMGLDLPLPGHVLGHGWWLVGGEKGAKSKGNIPTPQDAVEYIVSRSGASTEAAIDALRFYLIRDIGFTSDAEFSYETLVTRYNAYLANDLGNLLNRTLNMLRQYSGSVVRASVERTAGGPIATLAVAVATEAQAHFEARNPGAAIDAIWKLVGGGNKEIDTAAPWKLRKEGNEQGVIDALYNALEANRIASVLIAPILPHASRQIRRQLGLDPAVVPSWETAFQWGLVPDNTRAAEAHPIFPRIETKEKIRSMTEPTVETVAAASPAAAATAESDPKITIDDVMKLKLRIAKIKTAERVSGKDKLLHLTIDVGEGTDRHLLAGIAQYYSVDELPGKNIVVIANLQPRKMAGIESNGMLLAATDADGKAILLTPEKDVHAGAEVR
ncbi:MAG: methionine--tRNA ligase [Capsulimonadaceae bacterium]